MRGEVKIEIDYRYRGFQDIAQGGYTSGLLAGFIDEPARISLRAPVPMGRPLRVGRDEEVVALYEDSSVLAKASASRLDDVQVPRSVSLAEAEEASHGFPGHHHHPFPECFCCGPDRKQGDGLRIFPGRLSEGQMIAAPWMPDESVAGREGIVRPEIVWSALDCPQLFALVHSAAPNTEDRAVTAAMETELRAPVKAGERYVVVAWPSGGDGRRLFADAAILAESGEVLALSRQTAAITDVGVPLRLSAYTG